MSKIHPGGRNPYESRATARAEKKRGGAAGRPGGGLLTRSKALETKERQERGEPEELEIEDYDEQEDSEVDELEDAVTIARREEAVALTAQGGGGDDAFERLKRDFDKGGKVGKLKRELRQVRRDREVHTENARHDPELAFRPDRVTRFTSRPVLTLEGTHHKAVYWAEYCPEGKLIATCSHDHSMAVWDARTGALKRVFRGPNNCAHYGWVLQLAFSPDGKQLLSCSEDKTVRLWWVETGRLVHTFERHRACVMGVGWAPNGQRMVSCSKDRSIVCWNVGKAITKAGKEALAFYIPGAPVNQNGHTGTVLRAIFSPDARYILSCSQDKTIRLWDVEQEGKLKRIFEGHRDSVLGIAFHQQGARFCSCSHDKTVRIWNMRSGSCERELHGHTNIVYHCCFSPEERGARVLSCGHDRKVILWDARTAQHFSIKNTEHRSWVLCCGFSPDGRRIFTASGDHTVRVWGPMPPLEGLMKIMDSPFMRKSRKLWDRARDLLIKIVC